MLRNPNHGTFYTYFRTKYHHWSDVIDIIENGHFGLLRDRVKRNLFINATKNTMTAMCGTNIDDVTFDAVYIKYQMYFRDPAALEEAVGIGNIHIVKTLLNQRQPMAFKRDYNLTKYAFNKSQFKMLMYLRETGEFDNDRLVANDHMELANSLFKTRNSDTIRYMLKSLPESFVLGSLIRSHACIGANPQNIVMTGDPDLITELLAKDIDKIRIVIKSNNRYIVDYKELKNVTPRQQLEHLERLIDFGFIQGRGSERDPNALLKWSMDTTHTIALLLGDEDARMIDHIQRVDIGNEARMVFIKIGEIAAMDKKLGYIFLYYIMREYASTGDCFLIPYLMDIWNHTVWNELNNGTLFNNITKNGTLTQARVAIGYIEKGETHTTPNKHVDGYLYSHWIESKNPDTAMSVIKYFNNHGVTITSIIDTQVVTNVDMLNFLMSDQNKIFPSWYPRKFIGRSVLQAALEKGYPKSVPMHQAQFNARIAAAAGRLDIINLFLEYWPDLFTRDQELQLMCVMMGNEEINKQLSSNSLVDFTADHVWSYSGALGDPQVLEFMLKHCTLDKIKLEKSLNSMIDVGFQQDHLDEFIGLAVKNGHVETLEFILSQLVNKTRDPIIESKLRQYTTMLIDQSDTHMLHYLVHIGATLDTKGIYINESFRSNKTIQAIIERYKQQRSKPKAMAKGSRKVLRK
ncbi:hypothetical protein SAMD00019534_018120 [Acytostelium subglobosum LB1]|uniref:hypothetical protein n=1 Tax=Acytostelium subglobosum LB1 TaxID=1410327 RepID=UPI000644845E|nr:hypothetical protein SAMD00019534_018120 [Acytostelium subglobosum LB1]GAM18637.1 hypothetical protein SAMD00019534_018120 [Acytostelium subglobosum LB1]|eukprot:XP_012757857.1 hypothetical protein SAMD00019534_018120 [Acytostelium subglobosum LB1]